MTTPNPIPDMQVTTAADGTLIYSWEDGWWSRCSSTRPISAGIHW